MGQNPALIAKISKALPLSKKRTSSDRKLKCQAPSKNWMVPGTFPVKYIKYD